MVAIERFDFKGNPALRRRLAIDYENHIDWQAAATLLGKRATIS
jgi:hypothetical protein